MSAHRSAENDAPWWCGDSTPHKAHAKIGDGRPCDGSTSTPPLSRDQMVRWVSETLRSYGVPEHKAEQIAECFLDEGLCVIPPASTDGGVTS